MPRRLVAVGLVGALLLAACGGGDDDREAAPDATALDGGSTSTTRAGGTTVTTPPAATDGGSGGSGTGGTDGTPTTAVPPVASAIAPGGVGGLAVPLLRPGHGDRIVVEVRAQAGAEPRAATLDHLLATLRQVSGKTVALDGIDPLAGGAQSWTPASLAGAADRAAAHGQGGRQVTLRLLFVHGTFEGDDSVLGVAVRGDVAAVFTDRVDAAAGLLASPAVVEDAIAMHEVGHLLGLVDLVLDTGRDDASHPGHSTNEGSVMYWAVESDLIGQVLGGGIPTTFDAQDRADLARIRAG